MMKRNFIPLSFICITAWSTPVTAWADYSYHAEIPKDSKVSPDYLEKRKALGSVAPDANSWQRQLDEEKARMDAESARREAEKQTKCQQQEYLQRRRADNGKYQYYKPDPCAGSIGIEIPVY
ncbi:hypothetical protein CBW58_22480 [Yersinia frederiksenii]|nr:hypothetical protein CBW58_22480 [Yersinia frederiksenii]